MALLDLLRKVDIVIFIKDLNTDIPCWNKAFVLKKQHLWRYCLVCTAFITIVFYLKYLGDNGGFSCGGGVGFILPVLDLMSMPCGYLSWCVSPPKSDVFGRAFAYGARGLPFESHSCLHRYVEEIRSIVMLAAERLVGVAPEVNLRENVPCTLLPSANKAAHSGLEPGGVVSRSKIQGYQCPLKIYLFISKFEKKLMFILILFWCNSCRLFSCQDDSQFPLPTYFSTICLNQICVGLTVCGWLCSNRLIWTSMKQGNIVPLFIVILAMRNHM